MAAHAKSRSRIAAMTNWIAASLAAILVFGIGCVAGYQAKDSFGDAPYWIIFGGNTDKGNGQGGGLARDQLIAGGWVSPENSFQVTWNADISNTDGNTNAAMPAGHEAYDKYCGGGCVIAGFSLGNDPAIQLASEVGLPAGQLYNFGGPQPSTGIWHSHAADHSVVKFWIDQFGQSPNRMPPAGSHAFYDSRDIYANMAPQCYGPGVFSVSVQSHRIVGKNEPAKVWTGRDGIIMHEVGYQPPPFGLPRSGSDKPQLWDGCPPAGWFNGRLNFPTRK